MGFRGSVLSVVLLAAAAALPTHAQDTSAFEAGRSLGALLFPKHNNDVYYRTLQQRLDAENAMQQALQAKRDADAAEQLLRIRQMLAGYWQQTGMPQEEARAIAAAFAPSSSDDAVFLSVRGESTKQMSSDIQTALRDRNFQLANQLLIGALKELARQQRLRESQPAPGAR